MRKIIGLSFLLLLTALLQSCKHTNNIRTLSVEEYRDKMVAGWIGQMSGVGWGASTEFRFNSVIIPEDKIPVWDSTMVNQFNQDDIYVEMTFLKTLEDYGMNVSIKQAGIDFANSRYQLWHANKNGRYNLRSGIAPPFSGHPKYNSHADDIDYQIESDYSGLISPGLANNVIELGEKFGHIMNYGDGVYGGIFVGSMYAEAFFEKDINKIINAGLKSIPAESSYAEAIRDVISWHKKYPDNWESTWQQIENKYNLNPEYRKSSCNGADPEFNIDAKINGAYIVTGLLYGEGNMDKTIIISMRCGQDSDCNPSSAGGILATSIGYNNLPEKYKAKINDTTKFSFTSYNFNSLTEVCEALAREAIISSGGKIIKNSEGSEEFVIPVQKTSVPPLEQSWIADTIDSDVMYSQEDMEKITVKLRKPDDYISSWKVAGPFMKDGSGCQQLFDVKFEPEKNNNFSDWNDIACETEGPESGVVNLKSLPVSENAVAYLQTYVWSEINQEAIFEIGSDDGFKLWLNNTEISDNNTVRGYNQGDDQVKTTLIKGWNKIVMKVTQGTGDWCASLVITDLQHNPMKELLNSSVKPI